MHHRRGGRLRPTCNIASVQQSSRALSASLTNYCQHHHRVDSLTECASVLAARACIHPHRLDPRRPCPAAWPPLPGESRVVLLCSSQAWPQRVLGVGEEGGGGGGGGGGYCSDGGGGGDSIGGSPPTWRQSSRVGPLRVCMCVSYASATIGVLGSGLGTALVMWDILKRMGGSTALALKKWCRIQLRRFLAKTGDAVSRLGWYLHRKSKIQLDNWAKRLIVPEHSLNSTTHRKAEFGVRGGAFSDLGWAPSSM